MRLRTGRVAAAGRVFLVLATAAVALGGCVTPTPAPYGRRLFVPEPSPRSRLADVGEVTFRVSGTNWGADQTLIVDQCAFIKGEPERCEQMGSVVTGDDGSFALTTFSVHYMLDVAGTAVPCDAEIDQEPFLGVLGALFGGRFYSKHCAVLVRPSENPTDHLDVWIAFAGHGS